MIRATVLAVMDNLRHPASTREVISAVVERIEDRKVPGIDIVDRHEARRALDSLASEGKLIRHATGEVEGTRVRRSGRRVERAMRGTISWSLPDTSGTEPRP